MLSFSTYYDGDDYYDDLEDDDDHDSDDDNGDDADNDDDSQCKILAWLILKKASNTHQTGVFTPTLVQGEGGWGGGWMEPLPRVFDMLQSFEKILLSVESLLNKMR